MIVYPDDDYDSFISKVDAITYLDSRLNSEDFNTENAETALITAFRALNELDIAIDPTNTTQLQAIKNAQCEQALHEIQKGVESPFRNLSFPGLQMTVKDMPRFSESALNILRQYMKARTLSIERI